MVEYLKESRKSIKAACMVDAERGGYNTVALQEREAYKDPRYKTHLKAIKEAIGKAETLRLQIKSAELRFSQWQTQSANRRQERDRYGV